MRQRSVSSIGVVLVGLVPAIVGGWVFVIAFTALALLAFTEAVIMMNVDSVAFRTVGYGVIVLAGLLAHVQNANQGLPVLVTATVIVPLVLAIFAHGRRVMEIWTTVMACALYLSMPVFAAVSIRQLQGDSAGWLAELDGGTFGSDTGRGLGWFLLVLLVTWLSDTGAYLTGKSIGRRKLIPSVSPNKTVEGAIGGLASAAACCVLCNWLFELDMHPGLAIILGIVFGVVGILGDLAESMLKRQFNVKDSGVLIPGHGGVLDRIDALIFVLLTAWMLIPIMS